MKAHHKHILLLCSLTLLTHIAVAQAYPVKVKGKWGLITPTGELSVTAQYDAIPNIGPEHATIVMKGRYGLIDHQGKEMVETDFAFVDEKEAGLVWINLEGGEDNPGGKWGLINLLRDRRLEPRYDLIETFVGEWARVNEGGECDYDTCKGGLWGIINKNAEEIAPLSYTNIQLYEAGEAFVKTDSGWGRLGEGGEMTIPNQYDHLERLLPDMLIAELNDSFGLINDHNKIRIPLIYAGLKPAGEGFLAYQKGDKWGLMDTTGKTLTPPRFDEINALKHGWVVVREDRKWGLVSYAGKPIFNTVLTKVGVPTPELLPAERDRKWGVINPNGQILIPFRFDKVDLVGDTLIRVRVRHNTGYRWYTTSGKSVRSAYYDEIEPFELRNIVAKVKHQGRWGLINSQGIMLAQPRYKDIRLMNSTAKLEKSDGTFDYVYFDELGNQTRVRRIVLKKEDLSWQELLRPVVTDVGWYFATSTNLYGLMAPGSSRILIKPKYVTVSVVPNSNISIVEDANGPLKPQFGIVDHVKGQVTVEPIFDRFYGDDFLQYPLARGLLSPTQGYALVTKTGALITHENLTFVGEFSEGRARACVGGTYVWNDSLSMDTLESRIKRDRFTGDESTEYLHIEGGKWGFLNLQGEWKKEATYQGAMDFQDGTCRVKINEKWGIVDANWNPVVTPKFDYIETMEMPNGERLLLTGMQTPAYGFIDTLGELVIQPQFYDVGEFSEGVVRIQEGGKWGFADPQGNVVIEPQFNHAEDFSGGLARIGLKRGWDFIQRSGERLTGKSFLRANDYHEGLACVQDGEFFGYLDASGQFAIPPKFSKAGDYSQGLAPAWRKGDCGLIDDQGKFVIPPKYFKVWPFQDSIARIQIGGDVGLIDPQGDFILKPTYREIGEFVNGLAKVRGANTYGFIRPNGEIFIDLQYPNAGNFSEGLAPVFQKGKWGFVDTTGTLVIPANYSTVQEFKEGRAAVQDGKKWGFIDREGNVIIPLIYDQVRDFHDGRAAIYLIGLGWGFVNNNGVQVIPPTYESVRDYINGIARVKRGGKWGLVNEYGGAVTLLKYDDIGEYHEGLAKVLLVRKNGVLAEDGKEYLAPTFDTVKRFGDLVQVEVSDRIGYINTDGNWVWELSK